MLWNTDKRTVRKVHFEQNVIRYYTTPLQIIRKVSILLQVVFKSYYTINVTVL